MAAGEIHIKASAVGTREDLGEVLAMGAAGTVHCQVTTRPLGAVQEVLGELRRGEISGRVVLRIEKWRDGGVFVDVSDFNMILTVIFALPHFFAERFFAE